ncbi:hypothetical protein LNP25_22340 [Klebsiella variicola subsp. variicola]|nr:hypothetical protein [Klebsiella variicola subsp. variicola]
MFVSGSMTDIPLAGDGGAGVEHALCSEPVVVDEHSYRGTLADRHWRT